MSAFGQIEGQLRVVFRRSPLPKAAIVKSRFVRV